MDIIIAIAAGAAAVADRPSYSPPSPAGKPLASQTAQDRIQESADDQRIRPGTRLKDCLYSCCPEAAAADDDVLDEENGYCGSCGSLAALFAPFKSCWDAVVQCLFCLWKQVCPCLQSDDAKVHDFLAKWGTAKKPSKDMAPAARQKIATEWANDFVALPEQFQMKAFTASFKAAHPITTAKNFNIKNAEARRAAAMEHPVSGKMLEGIRSAFEKQIAQQAAEKAGE